MDRAIIARREEKRVEVPRDLAPSKVSTVSNSITAIRLFEGVFFL